MADRATPKMPTGGGTVDVDRGDTAKFSVPSTRSSSVRKPATIAKGATRVYNSAAVMPRRAGAPRNG